MSPRLRWIASLLLLWGGLAPHFAATAESLPEARGERRLVIGTKQAPPFAIKEPDGTWSGISIDLWRVAAAELHLDYVFEERDLASLLQGVENGSLDAAVAALTITSEREKAMDFTHPLHSTGFGIAVRADQQGDSGGLEAIFDALFSRAFAEAVGSLALVLLGAGVVVWAVERRKNPQHFQAGGLRGVGDGFWWAAVTMATVGYGDKVPKSFWGRVFGVIWMFASIILISTLTASIASSLTTHQLRGFINGPDDLSKTRSGAVARSIGESWLQEHRKPLKSYPTLEEALNALERGEVKAVVHDAPILRYVIKEHHASALKTLPVRFGRQDYGIALPSGSPLRKALNGVILRRIVTPEWTASLHHYLEDDRGE
ncbi:MAG: transporter substrate-binding domain-containing protein [Magnetococcales bacterium]|nr:transporter substrate-binding domain-containing protein [Magnetococcales bacterium]